jgi:hypothetical protein
MISNASLIVLSIMILLFMIYLKNTENFTNIKLINPQGSWVSNDTFNPGPAVENDRSLFPYDQKSNDGSIYPGKINIIKSDGVALGTYRPQIIRPFDSVSENPSKGSKCNWPCYSDKKQQKWCSEENAIKYHAMRPIISYGDYNSNLKKMFKGMKDVYAIIDIPSDDKFTEIDTAVFCTETQKSLMNWIMQKIAIQVTKMPEMQRNGSWGNENFSNLNVQIYQYVVNGVTFFKILFDLYNPLRSVSTYVVATILLENGDPKLIDMDFVNEGNMTDYVGPTNGFGPINGHKVYSSFKGKEGIEPYEPIGVPDSPEGLKIYGENYRKDPSEFNWNYINTLEVQKFNNKGFYSNVPGDNIKIEGGIPDSLRDKIKKGNCDNAQLLTCEVPRLSGVENGSTVFLGNSVQSVQNNPELTFKFDPMSLRGVETTGGTIYV